MKSDADLLVIAKKIYTLDADNSIATAVAFKDGRILATGTRSYLENLFEPAQTL